MTRIVVYGNCQAGPIGRLIERAAPRFEVVRVPPVHTILPEQIPSVEKMFSSADIILSQPIGDNFGPLSTASLQALSGQPEWIMFPAIYFDGFFPYLKYLRLTTGAPLKGPLSDYHDSRIIKSFISGITEKACEEAVHTQNQDLCRMHFASAIQESSRREEHLPIKVMDYVLEYSITEQAFHTFNHPSNFILFHVVAQFLRLLQIPMEATGAQPPVNQYLNEISAAIPIEMSQVAGLEYTECNYKVRGEIFNWDKLIKQFYELYCSTPNFQELCVKNSLT